MFYGYVLVSGPRDSVQRKLNPSCLLKARSFSSECAPTLSLFLCLLPSLPPHHCPSSSQGKLRPVFRLQLVRESSLSVESPSSLFGDRRELSCLLGWLPTHDQPVECWDDLCGVPLCSASFLLPPCPSIPLLICTCVYV